jgi:hypothetical protein
MTDIEVLSGFFKVFELFGLQYFSFKDLNVKTNRKWHGKFYIAYFALVLVLFSSAMTSYVVVALDIGEKKITAKTGFNFVIKIFMNFGLIASVIFGVIESFVKTNKLKEIYTKIKEVSMMCLVQFDFKVDYRNFDKAWKIKCLTTMALYLPSFGTLIYAVHKKGHKVLPYIVGFLPMTFFTLIVFKLVFHFDLVNFQLENMKKLMSNEVFIKVNTKNPVNVRHILQSRALAMRRVYNLIYDISEIVNEFLAVSALSSNFEISCGPFEIVPSFFLNFSSAKPSTHTYDTSIDR